MQLWLFQLASEPGPGQLPIALNRGVADAEDHCRFFNGKAAKKTELDDAGFLRIELRQTLQGFMHGQQFYLWLYARIAIAGKRNPVIIAAALCCLATARMIDQDVPHNFCGQTEK